MKSNPRLLTLALTGWAGLISAQAATMVFQDAITHYPPGEQYVTVNPTVAKVQEHSGNLAALCRQHADELEEVSAAGIPTKPGRVPAAALAELESQLRQLGWQRPPSVAELLGVESLILLKFGSPSRPPVTIAKYSSTASEFGG
jgi:hypothetical protein